MADSYQNPLWTAAYVVNGGCSDDGNLRDSDRAQPELPRPRNRYSTSLRKAIMSWDVILLRLPADATSVQEIPADHTPPPLGRRGDVLAAVTQAVPDVDLSDPDWGEISSPTWSIELNIGSNDPVDSVMLHIRGSGDDVLAPVLRLADALRCKAFDCAEGDLITTGQTSGWHAFQQFRDRAVGPSQ